jgi:multiple antibiotic resistance protein
MLDLAFALKVFAAMFAIMNPIANVPVFLSLPAGSSDAAKRRIAGVAMIGVTIGCVVSLVAGAAILHLFGITINDFRLAGLVLFLLLLGASMFAAPAIGHRLSPRAIAITKRLMGMILAAIAVEMMLASLQVFLKGVIGS